MTPALTRATGAGKKYYTVIIGREWEESQDVKFV